MEISDNVNNHLNNQISTLLRVKIHLGNDYKKKQTN